MTRRRSGEHQGIHRRRARLHLGRPRLARARFAPGRRPRRPPRVERPHRSGPLARRIAERIDWTDDAGQMGGVEAIPFGVLVFVIGTLVVAQAWAVVDVKFAADAAAREGVRTYVEAPDEATAIDASHAAATEAITGHGRDGSRLLIDPPDLGGRPFERCAPVTFTVHYPVPAITLPWIGGRGEAFTVSASHSEIIDPYRSGLPGGGC